MERIIVYSTQKGYHYGNFEFCSSIPQHRQKAHQNIFISSSFANMCYKSFLFHVYKNV